MFPRLAWTVKKKSGLQTLTPVHERVEKRPSLPDLRGVVLPRVGRPQRGRQGAATICARHGWWLVHIFVCALAI